MASVGHKGRDRMSARDVIAAQHALSTSGTKASPDETDYGFADDTIAALAAAGFEVVRAHKWFVPEGKEYQCCRDCGIVRRGDGRNRPCVGLVRVGMRQLDKPLRDEYPAFASSRHTDEGRWRSLHVLNGARREGARPRT